MSDEEEKKKPSGKALMLLVVFGFILPAILSIAGIVYFISMLLNT